MPPHVLQAHFDQLNKSILDAVQSFMDQISDLEPRLVLNPNSGIELTENVTRRRKITVRVVLDPAPTL